MFESVLVANRGEIAVRVIRTLRHLGIRSVAVFSDADRESRHVLEADDSLYLGATPARESYLNIERVMEACARSGANAVHPGYGFLSENAEFAQACADAGLVFVGPTAEMMIAIPRATASLPWKPAYRLRTSWPTEPTTSDTNSDTSEPPIIIVASAFPCRKPRFGRS